MQGPRHHRGAHLAAAGGREDPAELEPAPAQGYVPTVFFDSCPHTSDPMNRFFAAAALVLLAAGTTHAQAVPAQQQSGLHPGDVLRIEIWREKDLSGDFLVDENGTATLPLLGDRRVIDMPIPELRNSLLDAYRAQLRNPSISITPMRRLNVLGEVYKPGLYIVDPTVSLAEAVALAGGATPNGSLNKVNIVRAGRVMRTRVGVAQSLREADVRSGDQIMVPPRSWFARNSTFVVSTLISVTSIVIALVR
jgi:protein involved in polysaccharide export with SLBB domain